MSGHMWTTKGISTLLLIFCATFSSVIGTAQIDLGKKQPLFYIYEWPVEFDDLWPPMGSKLFTGSGYSHEFRANNGAGSLLDSASGLFNTWQFSLYKNVMSRLRVSEFRTRDPSLATSFIVPFDLGVHSYIDHITGKPRLASPHGWAVQYFLVNAAKDENLWWKNHGHDHFVMLSTTAYQMVGIGVKTFFMQICQNCSVLSIETSPTHTAIKGRTRKHWHAAPYPSSFHWHEKIEELPWAAQYAKYRDITVLVIGSVRTSQPTSNNLRKTLWTQCERDSGCQWHKTAHSCSGVLNATGTMLLIRRAKFCPAPTGDSLTRKSLFDSLVGGCIPVLFSKASLETYSWHLSKQDVSDVSVYIPMKQINEEGSNFMEILRDISPEEIARKQRAIEKLAPSLQYSVVPEQYADGVSPNGPSRVWRPPVRDAADVIIERILDRETVAPIDGWNDTELLRLVDLQNEIMDTHEDYAALRPATATQGGGVSGVGKEKGAGAVGNGNASYVGHSGKEQIAKGIKGISKLIRSDTIGYPAWGAITLSKEFIPMWVFHNNDIVEYINNTQTGKERIRYKSGSKYYLTPDPAAVGVEVLPAKGISSMSRA